MELGTEEWSELFLHPPLLQSSKRALLYLRLSAIRFSPTHFLFLFLFCFFLLLFYESKSSLPSFWTGDKVVMMMPSLSRLEKRLSTLWVLEERDSALTCSL